MRRVICEAAAFVPAPVNSLLLVSQEKRTACGTERTNKATPSALLSTKNIDYALKEQLDGWKHTHTHTHRSRHDVACCCGIYESSLNMTFALQGHAHQGPTCNTACRLRRKKRKEQNTRVMAVRGQIGFHQRWRERLRCERGALIGSLSAYTLVGFEICSLHLSWQQPDLRVQTQGEWRALPPLSLYLNCPRTSPISHWKHDTPPPPITPLELYSNHVCKQHPSFSLQFTCKMSKTVGEPGMGEGMGGGDKENKCP